MEILIAIELEPSTYGINDYERPNGTIEKKRKEWSALWIKCLSDSGIKNIKPIECGSWFVDIEQISRNNLEIIIKKHLEGINLSNFEDELLSFSGGIVIRDNNEIIIEPQCCCDLSNLDDWIEIKDNSDEFSDIWIGHPWVFYKFENNKIIFTDYYEQDLNTIEKLSEKIKLCKKDFLCEIEMIKEKRNEFEIIIRQVLIEMKIDNYRDIATVLVGKD